MTAQADINPKAKTRLKGEDVGVPIRRLGQEYDESIPDFWFRDNAFLSMLLAGFSAKLPEGEDQFIYSVRLFQDKVTNPILKAQVRAFIGQEAHHKKDTAREFGIDEKIRYQHRVVSANWNSQKGLWSLLIKREAEGDTINIETRFVICASGYYNYDHGHTPVFEGSDEFEGTIIHPQQWPEGLDYRDKKMVVIGSGATAVTLVPELAKKAAHVTMLQRSPSYVASVPAEETLAKRLSRWLPQYVPFRMAICSNVCETGKHRWSQIPLTVSTKTGSNWLQESI